MSEAMAKATTNLVCERCGESFHCGAKEQQCWCMQVTLSEGRREELSKQFKLCLCPACLKDAAKDFKDEKDAKDLKD